MRIPVHSLAGHLKREIASVYLLFGQEPLLIEESTDAIRSAARERGYDERLRLTVEPGFDWNQLTLSARSVSLFAERRLFELRMANARPGDKGAKTILAYLESVPEKTILVIIAGHIDKQGQSARWFKALADVGVLVEANTVPVNKFPAWIQQRLKSASISGDQDAVAQLAYYLEGNLLAAAQEIEKLALLTGSKTLSSSDVIAFVNDHARFSVYHFVDACLSGNSKRALRILLGLRAEGMDAVLVLWALARELRSLWQIASAVAYGQNQASAFKAHRVWSSRAALLSAALKRLDVSKCSVLLQRTAAADRMLKGRQQKMFGDIWTEIECLVLAICGLETAAVMVEV